MFFFYFILSYINRKLEKLLTTFRRKKLTYDFFFFWGTCNQPPILACQQKPTVTHAFLFLKVYCKWFFFFLCFLNKLGANKTSISSFTGSSSLRRARAKIYPAKQDTSVLERFRPGLRCTWIFLGPNCWR
jgi:hypothetical protein